MWEFPHRPTTPPPHRYPTMTSLQLPLPPPLECCTTSAATELGERHRRSPPHSPSFSAPSDGERADGKACRAWAACGVPVLWPHAVVPTGAKRAPPRAWTEAEHAAFLAGLEAGCRHRWAELARRFVPSRTAAQVRVWRHFRACDSRCAHALRLTLAALQVASHAQKHYLRLAAKNRRTSVEVRAWGLW